MGIQGIMMVLMAAGAMAIGFTLFFVVPLMWCIGEFVVAATGGM